MLIYVILIITILAMGYIFKANSSDKNKRIYIIIIGIILIIISGFRSIKVGADTLQFCRDFDNIKYIAWNSLIGETRYEIGFVFFCKLLGIICNDSQILIFFTSLIINVLICRFIYKESEDCVLSSYLYVTLNYFATNMNTMRQAIAMSIIILAYMNFLKKNKKVSYTVCILVACLFHMSAICGAFLLFLPNKKYSIKEYNITIVISIIAFLLADKLFVIFTQILGNYAGYIGSEFYEPNYFAAVIKLLVLFVILTVGYIYNKETKNDINSKYLYISSLALIFGAASVKITLLGRISNYFSIFNIILLPNILKNYNDKKQIYLVYYLVYVLCFLYWLIVAIYRPEWYGVIPYSFFMKK